MWVQAESFPIMHPGKHWVKRLSRSSSAHPVLTLVRLRKEIHLTTWVFCCLHTGGEEVLTVLQDGDDFTEPSINDMSVPVIVTTDATEEPESTVQPNVIKTRQISTCSSTGSLPELRDTLAIDADHSGELCSSTPDIATRVLVSTELAQQTHHSTAPCLHSLDTNDDCGVERSSELDYGLSVPRMSLSYSDEPVSQGLNTNRTALSKIKSSLSTVSQLIVHQSPTPQTRRRRQVLEAQLLDNQMNSSLRFKQYKTKILLL